MHPFVLQVQTTKRFWQCAHCNGRTTTLGQIYPSKRCPKCNDPGMTFKQASMYTGPTKSVGAALPGAGIAARENFLARGEEHAFVLGGKP
jgi:hypothetical protein